MRCFQADADNAVAGQGKNAFTVLMQQAKHEQNKAGSSGAGQKAQPAPDALTFLMQQARAGHPGTAPAPSTSGYACH